MGKGATRVKPMHKIQLGLDPFSQWDLDLPNKGLEQAAGIKSLICEYATEHEGEMLIGPPPRGPGQWFGSAPAFAEKPAGEYKLQWRNRYDEPCILVGIRRVVRSA